MEILEFRFDSTPGARPNHPALCGVVGSGNLEILVQSGELPDCCQVHIKTSARGFGTTWQAVLGDFAASHAAGGTTIAINDMGATPAVVSLRLAQALAEYQGGAQ
ncbi:MAG: malonate decarboxylase acyl carrier protein [Betaproteobacteria bacterium]|nr:malonate decarboxylase acyl carrier protein [Betaproteobacteria bacterium]